MQLLQQVVDVDMSAVGAARAAGALRALSLQALREATRLDLLRTPGLVATLIAIAGGDDCWEP